jgi:hypothetical protein
VTDEDTTGGRHADPTAERVAVGGPAPAAYDEWSDERLVDGYRRNSVLLREYGADDRTVQALCAIEERLRSRGIDPEGIVEELEG